MKRIVIILVSALLWISCEKTDDSIDYQDGYPNSIAGNWVAMEFADLDLSVDEAYNIYNLYKDLKIFDEELNIEFYDLVTALDPNSNDSLVIDNIYGSGIRVKVPLLPDKTFSVIHGKQLDVINFGVYGIYTVSLKGFLHEDEDRGDALFMDVVLYDDYNDIYDSVDIYAFRKTGFEDTEHQVLSE